MAIPVRVLNNDGVKLIMRIVLMALTSLTVLASALLGFGSSAIALNAIALNAIASSTGQNKQLAFTLESSLNANVPLRVGSRERVQFKLLEAKKQLEVRVGKTIQRFALPTLEYDPIQHGELLVADFNFDGFNDFMLPEDTGYGGVNFFDALYVFDPKKQNFVMLPSPEKDNPLWCNPTLEPNTKTLQTECKSGPAWYGRDYRFVRGKPVVYSSGNPASFWGFAAGVSREGEYVYVIKTDSAATVLSEDAHGNKPVIRSLQIARADLHSAPNDTTKTGRYIIKGDRLQILEVRQNGWCKIVYQSRKAGRLIAWIQVPTAEVIEI
jgi:hypothetical protein